MFVKVEATRDGKGEERMFDSAEGTVNLNQTWTARQLGGSAGLSDVPLEVPLRVARLGWTARVVVSLSRPRQAVEVQRWGQQGRMVAERPRVAQDVEGEGETKARFAVLPDTQVASSHSVVVQEAEAAHTASFQGVHSERNDCPLVQFLPGPIVVVAVHKGYAGGNEDGVASYALDEVGKRGDVE